VISVERSKSEENELIWWPPEPVLELARLALDSGGDPASIHRALDPTVLPVSFSFYFFTNESFLLGIIDHFAQKLISS
jgi:hypothetical protein